MGLWHQDHRQKLTLNEMRVWFWDRPIIHQCSELHRRPTESVILPWRTLLMCRILKGHWTSITSSPTFFLKSWDFYTISSVGMGKDWMLSFTFYKKCRLIYFWRNMNISSMFYFSKSTSINTQYSSLWDTLKKMLFTKYLIKWKPIGRISWKFWHWFNLKSSMELDIKKKDVILVQCPFKVYACAHD